MNGHKITDVDQGGSKHLVVNLLPVGIFKHRNLNENRLSSDGDSLIDRRPGIVEAHPDGRIYAKCLGVLIFLSITHLSIKHPGYSSRIGCSSGQQHQRPVGTGDALSIDCEARISNRHPCNRASLLVGLLIKDDASRNCNIRDRQGGIGELNSHVGAGLKSFTPAQIQHSGGGIKHDLCIRGFKRNPYWKTSSSHTPTCDPQTHSFAIHDKIRSFNGNRQQRRTAIVQRKLKVGQRKTNDGFSRRQIDRLQCQRRGFDNLIKNVDRDIRRSHFEYLSFLQSIYHDRNSRSQSDIWHRQSQRPCKGTLNAALRDFQASNTLRHSRKVSIAIAEANLDIFEAHSH